MKTRSDRHFIKKSPDRIVLYGFSPVEQCLIHGGRTCYQLYCKEGLGSARLKEMTRLAAERNVPVEQVDAHKLGQLSGTKTHQGVVLVCGDLAAFEIKDFLDRMAGRSSGLLIALDQIEDPQNFGAIIRSAAFLGAQGCMTLRRHSAPFSGAVSKASAGALESFPIIQVGNLSESLILLKKSGYSIVGASSGDETVDFKSIPRAELTVLVLGNEGQGLRNLTAKRCDFLVRIPGSDMVESLNVSAAAAILIHHFQVNQYGEFDLGRM